ncbi:MAG: nitroreductase family protein [Fusobacteria bacterium]|nr:nitroreductase family protein [Fusobacteriota bacterium]
MKNLVLDVIKSRRSIRKFKSTPITDEELFTIIEAGNFAPSGHNEQPWHFTVVKNSSLIDELSSDVKKECETFPEPFIQSMSKNAAFHVFYHAPMVIVVSAMPNGLTKVEDCSAATQNILLAAESLNIGTCWIEFINIGFKNTEFKAKYLKKLEIPEGATPTMAIAIGYKDMPNIPVKRKNETCYNIVE